MKTTPQPLLDLKKALTNRRLDMSISFDRPRDEQAEWWLDLTVAGQKFEATWHHAVGFGLFLGEPVLGDLPTEIHRSVDGFARRLEVLDRSVRSGGRAELETASQLREFRGKTQLEVAQCLKVRQPSVSRLENREELLLSSLAEYCRALDAQLELRIVGSDFDLPLLLPVLPWRTSKALVRFDAQYRASQQFAFAALTSFVLRVVEVELVKAFYEAVGMQFRQERHNTGPLHYSSSLNGHIFEIYPARGPQDVTHNARFGFSVPSIDAALESLRKISHHTPPGPTLSEFGPHVTLTDPAGTKVDLYQLVTVGGAVAPPT